jgi:methylmalonyl-CoA mutase
MADFPKKTLADWEKLAAKELRDRPLDDLTWMTPEGIPVKPLYTAADLEQIETVGSLRGPRPRCMPAALDDPPVCRLLDRRGATPSTAPISRPGRRACRSPSISPPTAAMTATIRASWAMSARPASRSIRVEDMKILFDGIPLDKMSCR